MKNILYFILTLSTFWTLASGNSSLVTDVIAIKLTNIPMIEKRSSLHVKKSNNSMDTLLQVFPNPLMDHVRRVRGKDFKIHSSHENLPSLYNKTNNIPTEIQGSTKVAMDHIEKVPGNDFSNHAHSVKSGLLFLDAKNTLIDTEEEVASNPPVDHVEKVPRKDSTEKKVDSNQPVDHVEKVPGKDFSNHAYLKNTSRNAKEEVDYNLHVDNVEKVLSKDDTEEEVASNPPVDHIEKVPGKDFSKHTNSKITSMDTEEDSGSNLPIDHVRNAPGKDFASYDYVVQVPSLYMGNNSEDKDFSKESTIDNVTTHLAQEKSTVDLATSNQYTSVSPIPHIKHHVTQPTIDSTTPKRKEKKTDGLFDPTKLKTWMRDKAIKLSIDISPRKENVKDFVGEHISILRDMSRKVISVHQVDLDVKYGEAPDDCFDIIYGDFKVRVSAMLIFFYGIDITDSCHTNQADYAFVGWPFAKIGITVITVNYPVEILNDEEVFTDTMTKAFKFILKEANAMEIKNIYLAGYSVGASIVGLFLSQAIQTVNTTQIKGAFLISGFYDWMFLEEGDHGTAVKESSDYAIIRGKAEAKGIPFNPIMPERIKNLQTKFPHIRMFLFYGEFDPKTVQEQAIEYSENLKKSKVNTELIKISWADHFNILEQLKDRFSKISSEIIAIIKINSPKFAYTFKEQETIRREVLEDGIRSVTSKLYQTFLIYIISLINIIIL